MIALLCFLLSSSKTTGIGWITICSKDKETHRNSQQTSFDKKCKSQNSDFIKQILSELSLPHSKSQETICNFSFYSITIQGKKNSNRLQILDNNVELNKVCFKCYIPTGVFIVFRLLSVLQILFHLKILVCCFFFF